MLPHSDVNRCRPQHLWNLLIWSIPRCWESIVYMGNLVRNFISVRKNFRRKFMREKDQCCCVFTHIGVKILKTNCYNYSSTNGCCCGGLDFYYFVRGKRGTGGLNLYECLLNCFVFRWTQVRCKFSILKFEWSTLILFVWKWCRWCEKTFLKKISGEKMRTRFLAQILS